MKVRIGEDVTILAGEASQTALRRDALQYLSTALAAIRAAEDGMPTMADAGARESLEELSLALRDASTACDALWYLAASDEAEAS